MENIKKYFNEKKIDFFFPVAFVLAIVPLIVRMTLTNADKTTLDIFGPTAQFDLFSQKKALILMIFSIILVIISIAFFKKIFDKRDKVIKLILIAIFVFLLFTFLSAIFSQYKQVSFWGIFDRAEGFITITCYIILFVYSIYTFKSTNDYKYVITPIIILVFINAFLGLFQYVGQDLLKSNLGTSIAVPSKYQTPNFKLNLLYEKGKLYGTLYHYNYVGSFVAIVLPILFCLTIFEDEDIMHKISLGIGFLLSICLLFGSTSRGGIIGILASAILGSIIFWKLIIKKRKPLLIFFISIVIIASGFNIMTKGSIFSRLPGLISDAFSIFSNTNDFDYREYTPVKDIQYADNSTNIILPNETLKISYANNDYIFKNSKDEIIDYAKKDSQYTTVNESFNNISFKSGKINAKSTRSDGLLLSVNNQPTFMFTLKEDSTIHLADINTKKDIDLQYPETFGFKGKEKLGSARGYIWSRSIPLLKDNLILGSGPDTFVYRFPQNDLIGKYYAYDTPNMVVDKPHNLYLQIGLNEGLIALLAFLVIMITYIVDSIRLYALKKSYDKSQILGAITCLGIIGYLFAGFFNDSVVSVAPVFWITLGVGVAVNFMNRTESNRKHK